MGHDEESPLPTVTLTPVPIAGRTELPRRLDLSYTQKVGRAVLNKSRPAVDNAIFDSKVLSRSHAEIWYDSGKVYIKDTKSSNGTYINDERLSACGIESSPRELKTGDRLTLGVDVLENNTASHKCVQVIVCVLSPGGATDLDVLKPFKNETSIATLEARGVDALKGEIEKLRKEADDREQEVLKLMTQLSTASDHQLDMKNHISQLSELLSAIEEAADDSFQGAVHQDRLLSRLDAMEAQLAYYMTRAEDDDASPDKALKDQLVQLQSDRHHYEMTAKESVKRIMAEKLEVLQRLQSVQKEMHTKDQQSDRERAKAKEQLDMVLRREKEIKVAHSDLKDNNADILQRISELEHSLKSSETDAAAATKTIGGLEEEVLALQEQVLDLGTKVVDAEARAEELGKALSDHQEAAAAQQQQQPQSEPEPAPEAAVPEPETAAAATAAPDASASPGSASPDIPALAPAPLETPKVNVSGFDRQKSSLAREDTLVGNPEESEILHLRKLCHDQGLFNKSLEERIVELQNMLKESNDLRTAAEADRDFANDQHIRAKATIVSLEKSVGELEDTVKQREDASNAFSISQQHLQRTEASLLELQQKHDILSQHAARYESELSACRAAMEELRAAAASAEAEREAAQGQQRSAQGEQRRYEAEVRSLQEQLQRANKLVQGANVQCKEATDNLRRKGSQCKDLEAAVERLKGQLASSLRASRRASGEPWDPEAGPMARGSRGTFAQRVGVPLAAGVIAFFVAMFLTKMGHI